MWERFSPQRRREHRGNFNRMDRIYRIKNLENLRVSVANL
jgi:hypothetical protein